MVAQNRILSIVLLLASTWLSSCQTIDLYEKTVAIPEHDWKSSFKPEFKFIIKDTAASYQLYIVLRHNEKYNYNNIWVNLNTQAPGTPPQKFMLELPLASSEKGWLGTAMDDLYEHRIAVTLDPAKFNFSKSGEYAISLEQAMREDPLQNVLNVGLRIEKKP